MKVSFDSSKLLDDILEDVSYLKYGMDTDKTALELEKFIAEEIKGDVSAPRDAANKLISTICSEIAIKSGKNHKEGEISPEAIDIIQELLCNHMYILDPIVTHFNGESKISIDVLYVSPYTYKGRAEDTQRDSVYAKKYPAGIYDIVSLLNDGYTASRSLRGKWHDKEIQTLMKRRGAKFFEAAVDDFKGNYGYEYNVVDVLYTELVTIN